MIRSNKQELIIERVLLKEVGGTLFFKKGAALSFVGGIPAVNERG